MKIKFKKKPIPLFPEFRPLFKISQIIMVLGISTRGNKSSLLRLHLFNWALNKEKRRTILLNLAEHDFINIDVWRIDPFLNSALNFALAEDLLNFVKGMYILTDKGKQLLNKIILSEDFKYEVLFFQSIGKGITETKIKTIQSKWE